MTQREDENEINYYCDNHGIGLTPYSPLSRGVLAKPVKEFEDDEKTAREATKTIVTVNVAVRGIPGQENDIAIIDRIGSIAEQRGTKRAVISLAWSIHKGANSICGIGSVARLDDIIEASIFELNEEEDIFFWKNVTRAESKVSMVESYTTNT